MPPLKMVTINTPIRDKREPINELINNLLNFLYNSVLIKFNRAYKINVIGMYPTILNRYINNMPTINESVDEA